VAGSHRWEQLVLPPRSIAETSFYPDDDTYMFVPDPDAEGMTIHEWELKPGDAGAFNYITRHSAQGNDSPTRRRAFSLRLIGDDVCYGPISSPFPDHGMTSGQSLREDWFPVLLDRQRA